MPNARCINNPFCPLGRNTAPKGIDDMQHGPGPWRRSSRCSGESTCVEVALLDGDGIGIRDAKLPASSPYLAVDRDSWRAFLSGVKAGEFGGA
jgi:hypothetical protein